MSRVIQAKSAVVEYSDTPPIPILPEDTSDVLDAIDEMQLTLNALKDAIGAPKTDNSAALLQGIVSAIAAGNRALMEKLDKPTTPAHWKFKVVRDSYGDLDYVDAREVE